MQDIWEKAEQSYISPGVEEIGNKRVGSLLSVAFSPSIAGKIYKKLVDGFIRSFISDFLDVSFLLNREGWENCLSGPKTIYCSCFKGLPVASKVAAAMEKLTRQVGGKKIVLCPVSAKVVKLDGVKIRKVVETEAFELL